jgi:hypothetical protein
MVRSPRTSWWQPVEARIDHDSMQPSSHLSLASVAASPPERCDVGVLQCVGGMLGVSHNNAQSDHP